MIRHLYPIDVECKVGILENAGTVAPSSLSDDVFEIDGNVGAGGECVSENITPSGQL